MFGAGPLPLHCDETIADVDDESRESINVESLFRDSVFEDEFQFDISDDDDSSSPPLILLRLPNERYIDVSDMDVSDIDVSDIDVSDNGGDDSWTCSSPVDFCHFPDDDDCSLDATVCSVEYRSRYASTGSITLWDNFVPSCSPTTVATALPAACTNANGSNVGVDMTPE